jgi:hypothetical protein
VITITLGSVAWWYGPSIWRTAAESWLARLCANFEPVPGQIAWAKPGGAHACAYAGVDPRGGYRPYGFGPVDPGVRTVDDWTRLMARLEPQWPTEAVLFLHERTSPSGHRRLVCVSVSHMPIVGAVVIDNALGREPRIVNRDALSADGDTRAVIDGDDSTVYYVGREDPHDASRFTIPYHDGNDGGGDLVINGRLMDDDTVKVDVPGAREKLERCAERRQRDSAEADYQELVQLKQLVTSGAATLPASAMAYLDRQLAAGPATAPASTLPVPPRP